MQLQLKQHFAVKQCWKTVVRKYFKFYLNVEERISKVGEENFHCQPYYKTDDECHFYFVRLDDLKNISILFNHFYLHDKLDYYGYLMKFSIKNKS